MPTIIINRPAPDDPPGGELVEQAAAALSAAGCRVLVTPDLYHLADDDPLWDRLAALPTEPEGSRPTLLSWLHPRAAEWLLRRRGVDCDGWTLLNLQAYPDAAAVVAAVEAAVAAVPEQAGTVEQTAAEAARRRWYPVVDLSRCTDCRHCLQFCLFGVYTAEEAGPVCVTAPDNCKAGCPACSRVCPSGAIMFPLYSQDPAIAGAPGQFVERDAEARRMFYSRTEKPCPLCAARTDGAIAEISADGCCPECGRELEAEPSAPSAALAEIDALISRLEDLTGGRD